jgi:hypothetical protein
MKFEFEANDIRSLIFDHDDLNRRLYHDVSM